MEGLAAGTGESVEGPQKTLGEPAATEVQPAIASPIRPAPTPLTITEIEPIAIGAV